MEDLYLKELLHLISQGLLYPVIIVLIVLIVVVLVILGAVIVEGTVERRHYRVAMPQFVAAIDAGAYSELPGIIEQSGLLRSQKNMLKTFVAYGYLPEDTRVALAKRLLADMEAHYDRITSRTDMIAKISPMVGLMGTLIPLGPGIESMGSGHLDELASSIGIAFDTTVAGLVVAAAALLLGRFRKGWYEGYLVTLESAMEAILEKARICKERGDDLGNAETAAQAMAEIAAQTKSRRDRRLIEGAADVATRAKFGPADDADKPEENEV